MLGKVGFLKIVASEKGLTKDQRGAILEHVLMTKIFVARNIGY